MSPASLHHNHLLSAHPFTCLQHHNPLSCSSSRQFTCLLHHNHLLSAQQFTCLLHQYITIIYCLHNSLHVCCITTSQSPITCTTVYMSVASCHNPLPSVQQSTCLLHHSPLVYMSVASQSSSLHVCCITVL